MTRFLLLRSKFVLSRQPMRHKTRCVHICVYYVNACVFRIPIELGATTLHAQRHENKYTLPQVLGAVTHLFSLRRSAAADHIRALKVRSLTMVDVISSEHAGCRGFCGGRARSHRRIPGAQDHWRPGGPSAPSDAGSSCGGHSTVEGLLAHL